MADLRAKALDMGDKLFARLYFVVGALIGIFTGILSAIPQLPQILEGLREKAKKTKARTLWILPWFGIGTLRLECMLRHCDRGPSS
jgi:hypothetical protein